MASNTDKSDQEEDELLFQVLQSLRWDDYDNEATTSEELTPCNDDTHVLWGSPPEFPVPAPMSLFGTEEGSMKKECITMFATPVTSFLVFMPVVLWGGMRMR